MTTFYLQFFVGRSERSDLRHLILHSVEKRPPTSHLTFCRSDLVVAIIRVGQSEQSDPRQIAKKVTKIIFFNHKKPMKTTHKPRRKLTLDQFYQKLPLCQKKLPYGNLLRRNIPMKFNDIHKQFAVKSFAKMMTRSETQGRSR